MSQHVRNGHSHEIPAEALVRVRVKAELRKRMRALRKTAPLESCRERSQKIVAAVAHVEPLVSARSVALFWPIEERHEVDLRELDALLRSRGVAVYYPAIKAPENAAEVAAMTTPPSMTFRLAAKREDLAPGDFGFSQPPESAPEPEALDVIVVPSLAVDDRGHRLGYGAGYYDRTIPKYAPPAKTIVVAYEYQRIIEVPINDGDVACDFIATDARFGPRAAT
jgi:5-formyltetrahydrofolate cyclo-ligase